MKNKKRKTDRRTLYTINVIKDAFLELIEQEPYAKITVSQLCRKAEITRSTFYLHFDSITDVLNEILDDALLLSKDTKPVEDMSKIDYLSNNESLLPACQRIGSSGKYQKLLMEPDLSEYIIGRIMAHERKHAIPSIMKKTGLTQEEAETLFLYTIHGSFAVNRSHHFIKDQTWARDVKLLNQFIEAGYRNLKDK